jgi:hypothetical protein
MPRMFLAAVGEHYKLHQATGGGGGLSNRKVANYNHEKAATVGVSLSNGKVHKDDSTCLSKRLRL